MAVTENFCREIRERKQMNGSELARQVGVTRATINGFEQKRHGLKLNVLIKIANVLEVSLEELIPGYVEKNKTTVLPQKADIVPENSRKAVKLTHQYFVNDKFSEEEMIQIGKKVYKFLELFENLNKDKNDVLIIKQNLKNNLYRGLAAKCFLNFIKDY